jgi:hypothetical protein
MAENLANALGPRLIALRNDLRDRFDKSSDEKLLLEELEALGRTVWIVGSAKALGLPDGSDGQPHRLEIRVSSGEGGGVLICSTCPYAGA